MTIQSEQISLFVPNHQYLFTVFTPTYNRAHTLHRVYESLKTQTYRNFEWLIVDDGSTDRTHELVEKWQNEDFFLIRYISQENSGKHVAFNQGVREAKGELFINLDSDDSCVPQALERLKYHWDTIPENQKKDFSDVTCLCQDQHGKMIGKALPSDIVDSNWLEIRYRYKVMHEKWGFHRTEVLWKFPFAEEIKQPYIPESLVWHRISKEYKTRFINEYLRVYWTDTLSLMRGGALAKSANGNRIRHLAILNEEIDWLRYDPLAFLRSAVHYSRFSFHLSINKIDQLKCLHTRVVGKILWLIALPLGYVVYLKDKASH
jgi:glycosyltransferase involved in cell wall biosynthesis